MPTIDSYVVHSRTNFPRRFPARRFVALAFVAGVIGAGALAAGNPWNSAEVAARPKLAERIVESPSQRVAGDEARLAAFQQAVAMSYVSKSAFAPLEEQRPAAIAPEPQAHPHPPRKPDAAPVKKTAGLFAPVPPTRPAIPEAVAILPPTAPATEPPAPTGYFGMVGHFAELVERVPGQVGDMARGASHRALGAVASARTRIGL